MGDGERVSAHSALRGWSNHSYCHFRPVLCGVYFNTISWKLIEGIKTVIKLTQYEIGVNDRIHSCSPQRKIKRKWKKVLSTHVYGPKDFMPAFIPDNCFLSQSSSGWTAFNCWNPATKNKETHQTEKDQKQRLLFSLSDLPYIGIAMINENIQLNSNQSWHSFPYVFFKELITCYQASMERICIAGDESVEITQKHDWLFLY